MREAFSNQYGNPAQGAASLNSAEMDRLRSLRQAIDSIEQRLNSQNMMSAQAMNSGDELAQMQAQLARLSAQIQGGSGQPATQIPAQNSMDAAAAAISRRQNMLNEQNDPASIARTVADNQKTAMEAIAKQFATLKVELSDLKSELAKPGNGKTAISDREIKRIAAQLSGMQQAPQFDESSFTKLTQELGQLRSSMKEDLQKELATTRNVSARLDSLSDGVSDMAGGLSALTHGLDGMSTQAANIVAPKVDQLAGQMDALRATIDDLPQTLAISRLENNLNEVSQRLEGLPTNASALGDDKKIASIEGRLDEVARALVAVSNIGNRSAGEDVSSIERIEARFTELSRALDTMSEKQAEVERVNKTSVLVDKELQQLSTRIEALTERLGSFEKYAETGDLGGASALFAAPDLGVIEDQLAKLATRLDEAAADNSTASQISNLEAQIGQILRQMTKQGETAPIDFTPVENRLGQIENTLASNQQFSVEAAQQAAQKAVAMLGPASDSGQVIAALSKDLKSLQNVAESGSAMNQQSISDMHGLLTQVVERLGTIESNIADGAKVVPDEPRMPPAPTLDPAPQIAAAAQQTVNAAQGVVAATAPQQPTTSYTITRGGNDDAPIDTRTVEAPSIDPVADINADMDGPSSGAIPDNHAPLEPGENAAPDLNRMVEEASAQLVQTKASIDSGDASYGSGADNIRPDPVGAARRALQATTEEMNAVRDEVSSGDKKSKSAIKALLSKFSGDGLRKPVVIAAAATLLFVLATFGYNKFMAGGENQVASVNNPAIEQSMEKPSEEPISQAVPDSSQDATNQGATNLVAPQTTFIEKTPARSVDQVTQAAVPNSGDIIEGNDAGPTDTQITTQAPEPKSEIMVKATPEPVAEPKQVAAPAVETASYEVPGGVGSPALKKAASKGEPSALFEVGMRYSDGKTVKRDMVESAKWFERSAEAGFAPAQYSIGSLYEKGIGVSKDIKKAAEWYDKAALQGNARAMHNLAVIHAMGNDGPADMDTAVGWFKKAAEFGIKDSQFNLGILYGQGMGVPQNLAQSYKWFALAAKTGDTDAAGKKDEVANAMDPAQLDAARKEVASWQPAKLDDAVNRVTVPKEWQAGAAANLTGTKQKVQQAQTQLNERGFDVGTPDGLMGPKTQRAIMEFQRAAGLPVTGKVDGKLLNALGVQT